VHGHVTELAGRSSQVAVQATHENNIPLATRYNSINMSQIEAAIAAIESLEPGEQFSYRRIAAEHHCNRTTLARRHQGLASSRSTMAENQQALHPQQEQELLRYIERLTQRGLSPTRAMISRFASDIAKQELSVRWVDRFIARHDADLISRWATGIDRARHQADSLSKYTLNLSLLYDKISKYDVEAGNMYNMDKKCFLLGILTRSTRVFSRRLYEEGKIKAHI
jgi:DNA-binding transcriptional regulator YhcF (GntR family)